MYDSWEEFINPDTAHVEYLSFYDGIDHSSIWTGSEYDLSFWDYNCNSWTSLSAQGAMGETNSSLTEQIFGLRTDDCNNQKKLLCLCH